MFQNRKSRGQRGGGVVEAEGDPLPPAVFFPVWGITMRTSFSWACLNMFIDNTELCLNVGARPFNVLTTAYYEGFVFVATGNKWYSSIHSKKHPAEIMLHKPRTVNIMLFFYIFKMNRLNLKLQESCHFQLTRFLTVSWFCWPQSCQRSNVQGKDK